MNFTIPISSSPIRFFEDTLHKLEILTEADTPREREFFKELFREMLTLFTTPFNQEEFDFSDPVFWSSIASLSQKFSKDPPIRKMNGNRGSKHFLYINRTFFGLYHLLHDLQATIEINRFKIHMRSSAA